MKNSRGMVIVVVTVLLLTGSRSLHALTETFESYGVQEDWSPSFLVEGWRMYPEQEWNTGYWVENGGDERQWDFYDIADVGPNSGGAQQDLALVIYGDGNGVAIWDQSLDIGQFPQQLFSLDLKFFGGAFLVDYIRLGANLAYGNLAGSGHGSRPGHVELDLRSGFATNTLYMYAGENDWREAGIPSAPMYYATDYVGANKPWLTLQIEYDYAAAQVSNPSESGQVRARIIRQDGSTPETCPNPDADLWQQEVGCWTDWQDLFEQNAQPEKVTFFVNGEIYVDNVSLAAIGGTSLPCDFNGSGTCDDIDINLLATAVRNGTSDAQFNVDGLGDEDIPDNADFDFYITDTSMIGTGHGDADLNKIVNFVDFVSLSNNFGMTGTGWANGNFNTDDNTNFNDFVALSNNFGASFVSGSNVPEPAVMGALGLLSLILLHRRI